MKRMRCAFLVLALAACFGAHAKGIFQAQGRISEVERAGDTLTFRFTGWISFGYASAPDSDPKRRWRDMGWDKADVRVRIGEGGWTRRYKDTERDDRPDVDAVQPSLVATARSPEKATFSVDNPGLTFSNRGELVGVTGTYIYARSMR